MKTTNYEISKKLAKIGFKTDTKFYWEVDHYNGEESLCCSFNKPVADMPHFEYVPAYDLETILDALPKKIETEHGVFLLQISIMPFNKENRWLIGYSNETDTEQKKDEPLVDTAARLLLKLVKQKIIDFK